MANLLQGGKKRRRASKWAAALVIVLAPLAVGAAAFVALHGKDKHSGPSVPVATHAPHHHRAQSGPRHHPKPVPVIRMGSVDAFRYRFHSPPQAGILVDLDNGDALWRLHPRDTLPIASLTKIMTALLVTERTAPDDRVRITKAALNYREAGLGVLKRGKRIRLETLLNGLLLVSANDAAIALAVHVAGTERRFVRLMNHRAREWGLRCTHYYDSYGLNVRNRSCPHDLAVLARFAMTNRRIRRIVRRPQVTFRFPIKGGRIVLPGHNPLIRAHYRGAIGLKTGFTDPAGRCFVGVARRHGRTLAVVLLNSPNPLKHSAKLLNEGFAHD
jgi:serine-type D-Ala-D-Ala carboxypeptidase (penicillin-binding protein 5/6)